MFQSSARAEEYVIDNDHTAVEFEVSHLSISSVKGRFMKSDGFFQFDPSAVEKTTLESWVDAASVNTAQEKRDKHLRGPDFFDAKQYPRILFKSTSVKQLSSNTFQMSGNFTMHGVTKPVVFNAKYKGTTAAGGKQRTAFRGTLKIIRQDFGITFGVLADAVPLVGDEVEITINVEGIRKKDI